MEFTQRIAYWLLLAALGLLALLPLVFIAAGAWMLCAQHYRMASYVPVQATIISQHTERTGASSTRSGRHAVKPVIEYRYQVNGRIYTCEQVTPVDEGRSGWWAEEILSRYDIGQTYEAYYNPRQPGQAFLLAQYSFLGGYLVLFPLMIVLAVLGLLIATGTLGRGYPAAPPSAVLRKEWHELPATATLANRRLAAYVTTLLWYVAGLLVGGHYFLFQTPPYDAGAVAASAVYGLLGLIPLGYSLRFGRISRRLRDARVFVDRRAFSAGDTIRARVEQPVRRAVRIARMQVALVCKGRDEQDAAAQESQSESCHDTIATHHEAYAARSGEVIRAESTFALPPDLPLSTGEDDTDSSRCLWLIRVNTQLENGPAYHSDHPLKVKGSMT